MDTQDQAKVLCIVPQYNSKMSNNSKEKLDWILNQNYAEVTIGMEELRSLITNAFTLGYNCGKKDWGEL